MDDLVTEPASPPWPPRAPITQQDVGRLYGRYTARTDLPPWTTADLTTRERAAHLDLLLQWVDYLNTTYTWTAAHLIPPCWPVHPGLERELTTLYWSHYEAFETGQATPGAAQVWHDRYRPGFHSRLANWINPECQQGRHQPRPAADLAHRHTTDPIRGATLDALDTALADAPQRPGVPRPPAPLYPARDICDDVWRL